MKLMMVLLLTIFSQNTFAMETIDFSACAPKAQEIIGRSANVRAHHFSDRLDRALSDANSFRAIADSALCSAIVDHAERKAAEQAEKDEDTMVMMCGGNLLMGAGPAFIVASCMQTMFM